jgi:uncharacterized protein
MMPFTVRLMFHGDLSRFLTSKRANAERQLSERTSVKDIIEACGIPHTEIDLLLVNGRPVDFAHVLGAEASLEVYPIDAGGITPFPENRLQVRTIYKFIGDGHLGKLVRDLRLLGIDVAYDRAAEDRQLVKIAAEENRALLTRDRRLLMHSAVRHGYYLRSQNPLNQTVEVLRRFDLNDVLAPFSRCLRCNAPLEPVEKARVIDRLEPLTKIYYETFQRCPNCEHVYWRGSHFDKLIKRIEEVHSSLADDSKPT